MKKILLILISPIWFVSCSTNMSYKDVESSAVTSNGYRIEYVSPRNMRNGRYVSLEQKDGRWMSVKQYASAQELGDIHSHDGELFWINTDEEIISPYYGNKAFGLSSSHTYKCGSRVKVSGIRFCASEFSERKAVSVITMLVTLGVESYKAINFESMVSALNEAGVFSYIRLCNKNKEVLASYVTNNVHVKPKIIDKTGFYNNESLIKTTVSSQLAASCEVADSKIDVKYEYRLQEYKTKKSHTNRTKSYDYALNGLVLSPKITLLGKYPVRGFKKAIRFRNRHLSGEALSIVPTRRGNMSVQVDFNNISNNYITINKISFYVGDYIVTQTVSPAIELPPQATKRHNMYFSDYTANKNIMRPFTKDQAKNTTIQLGISMKYRVKGESHSLFSKKPVAFIKAI